MKPWPTVLERGGDAALDLEDLAHVAGVSPRQVATRKTLRARPTKVTERIELLGGSDTPARVALLKWGSSIRLRREILLYTAFFDPNVDPVPRMVGYHVSHGLHVLLLEWIEGAVPDLSRRDVVERWFLGYGRWVGRWSGTIHGHLAGKNGPFWRPVPPALQPELIRLLQCRMTEQSVAEVLERLGERYLACANLLESVHGPEERALFRWIAENGVAVAEAVFATPVTLASVDLSAGNVLFQGATRQPIFLDFEHAGICPAAMAVGGIGETSGLVPVGSLGEGAKESFLDGWSASAPASLDREAFYRSQRCARLFFKCHEVSRFFGRMASSPDLLRVSPWRGWWPRAWPDLARVVRAVQRELG